MLRWIMHVDMDAFYASVEQLDNPELRGLPVIVGGDHERSVVSTCSYEARKFGVRSAMSIAMAKRLCPQGIIVPVRMPRYLEKSREIMQIFHELSPLVEQLSVDEAFLDMSGMEGIYCNIREAGELVKRRIKEETGLTASVGLAPNKFLAKIASDLEKPDGLTIIEHAKVKSFIAPLKVGRIFGVGKAAQQQLLQYGITTIGQLHSLDFHILQKVFGKNAYTIKQLAEGIDSRPVVPEREAQSIGREVTFSEDLHTYSECQEEILWLCGQVGYRLRRQGFVGRTVTVKVKYADFTLKTHSYTSDRDIFCDEDIITISMGLLKKVSLVKGIRLLGVTVGSLSFGASINLGFEEEERLKKRNEALDNLKNRFGEGIIHRGKY